MSSTVHTNYLLFRNSIAPFNTNIISVLTKSYCKNDYPHYSKWRFEFVGTESEYKKKYLPKMAYFFDDGLSQSTSFDDGKGFKAYMGKKLKNAVALSESELKTIGVHCIYFTEKIIKPDVTFKLPYNNEIAYGWLVNKSTIGKLLKKGMDSENREEFWHQKPFYLNKTGYQSYCINQ